MFSAVYFSGASTNHGLPSPMLIFAGNAFCTVVVYVLVQSAFFR